MPRVHSRSTRALRRVGVGTAAVALLGLTACSGDSDTSSAAGASKSSADSSSSAPESTAGDSTASPSSSAAAAGGQPEWADPVTTPGQLISTVQAGDITVDVYQVGVTQATETGNFVDPTTNRPIIAVGDDIVFVNYVVTNEGAPVDLGPSLVDVSATYEDWPYLQGMDAVTDSALYEQQGVNDSGLSNTAFRDPSVYGFGTGQSFSYGENFRYQAGSPITFDVTVTPVDAAGELLFDQQVEASGTGTIA